MVSSPRIQKFKHRRTSNNPN